VPNKTSLDVLEREDLLLRDFFKQIEENRGESVEQRYTYGNASKQVIRHVSVRQSALIDVATSISEIPSLCQIAERMIDRATARRELIHELVVMSRSVQGMYLNSGQDFDGPLTSLIGAISVEVDWELSDAIPQIRQVLDTPAKLVILRSARYVTRHAPTTLTVSGPRWYERAPVVSRIMTLFNHLRDHPRAARNKRVS
jgi:hypothetical protein